MKQNKCLSLQGQTTGPNTVGYIVAMTTSVAKARQQHASTAVPSVGTNAVGYSVAMMTTVAMARQQHASVAVPSVYIAQRKTHFHPTITAVRAVLPFH